VSAPCEPVKSATTLPVYFTPEQVGELLGVKAKTVLRWALEDASMPKFRRGKVVRFERDRLLTWLARQEPRSSRRITQGSRKDLGSAA
jgi:excisionase family DNA binding protein